MIKKASIKAGKVNVVSGQELIRKREVKAEEKKEHRDKKVSRFSSRVRRKLPEKPHACRARAAVSYKCYNLRINSPVMKRSLRRFRIALRKE